MNTDSNQITSIDLSELPLDARKKVYDLYLSLLHNTSNVEQKAKVSKKSFFLNSIQNHRFHLPEDYLFERDLSNER